MPRISPGGNDINHAFAVTVTCKQRQSRNGIPGSNFRTGQFHRGKPAGTILAREIAGHGAQFHFGNHLTAGTVPLSAEFMTGRTKYFDSAQFGKIARAEQPEIGEITFLLSAELRQTGEECATLTDEITQFVIIFRNQRIPSEVEQKFIAMEKSAVRFHRDFIKITIWSAGKKVPLFFIFLSQRMRETAGHQHIQQLTAFFGLGMPPFGKIPSELSPD